MFFGLSLRQFIFSVLACGVAVDAEAARVSARDNISPQSAAAKVKKVNHERAIHCRHSTKTDWGTVTNYDLCIKSDDFGVAETAQIIGDLFQKKMGL